MQNFGFLKIRSFCNSLVPIVLILQLLSGSALTFDSHNKLALDNYHEDSSIVLACCAEDIEDEESKSHTDTSNILATNNCCYYPSVTNPYLEYFSNLNHSRSPPIS